MIPNWIRRPGSQREEWCQAPRRAKDGESGADFSRPRGKASLLPLLRACVGGYMQEFPA